jgi:hypothetical protein
MKIYEGYGIKFCLRIDYGLVFHLISPSFLLTGTGRTICNSDPCGTFTDFPNPLSQYYPAFRSLFLVGEVLRLFLAFASIGLKSPLKASLSGPLTLESAVEEKTDGSFSPRAQHLGQFANLFDLLIGRLTSKTSRH